MSERGFDTGEESTIDLGDGVSLPEDVGLCLCIDDAIKERTGEGASGEQRLAAVEALLDEDEEFGWLMDRLHTLIGEGKARALERAVAELARDREAEV